MDNRGKGSQTKEDRVEKNYSRPTESKPSHSESIEKTIKDVRGNVNNALNK